MTSSNPTMQRLGTNARTDIAKGIKPIFAIAVVMIFAEPTFAAPQAKVENCGWLSAKEDVLVPQPDSSLKPSDPAPLSKPPPQAKAAYCDRDTLMTYVGDERVLKLGLPLVIRSGGREGALEATPTVLFNFHRVGEQYLPGKAQE
jgi:hypothetical protein